MAKNGYKIFDSDTHVGPFMDVLDKYLTETEQHEARRLGGVQDAQQARPPDLHEGPAHVPAPARRCESRPGAGGLHGGLHRRQARARAVAARRSRSRRAHQGHGLRRRRREPHAAVGLVRHVDHGRRRRARNRHVSRVSPLDAGLLQRLSAASRRRDPRLARATSKAGVEEIKRWGKSSWAWGVMVYAPYGVPIDHPDLEPIWAEAAAHDLAVILHTFTVMPPYAPGGLDTWENLFVQRSAAHPWCGMRNMAALIGSGVMDRYPKLRIGTLEAGHGWLPFWMKRLDEHARDDQGGAARAQDEAERIRDERALLPEHRSARRRRHDERRRGSRRRRRAHVRVGLSARREPFPGDGEARDGVGDDGGAAAQAHVGQRVRLYARAGLQ